MLHSSKVASGTMGRLLRLLSRGDDAGRKLEQELYKTRSVFL